MHWPKDRFRQRASQPERALSIAKKIHQQFWADVFRTVRLWIARSRQRKALGELAELNNYLLADIGLTREEALREAAKPFWRR
jgi:uncharacterized protein YjiS (DUF1127 family)